MSVDLDASMKDFVDAVGRGFERMIETYREASRSIAKFYDVLVVEPRRRRTREIVRAQRRRRGR